MRRGVGTIARSETSRAARSACGLADPHDNPGGPSRQRQGEGVAHRAALLTERAGQLGGYRHPAGSDGDRSVAAGTGQTPCSESPGLGRSPVLVRLAGSGRRPRAGATRWIDVAQECHMLSLGPIRAGGRGPTDASRGSAGSTRWWSCRGGAPVHRRFRAPGRSGSPVPYPTRRPTGQRNRSSRSLLA